MAGGRLGFPGIGAGSVERLITLAMLVGFVAVRVWDPAPLEILRLKTFDLYQILAPRVDDSQHKVAIVDIDEESLDLYGQWPWPRTRIAELVTAISQAGGVAIAFDVIFAEPDRLSPSKISENLIGGDAALKARLSALPNNDQVLARAMKQTRVVLGQSGYHRKITQSHARATAQVPLATLGPDPKPFLFDFPSMIRNIPVLEDAAAGRGLVTIIPERDGVVRRVPMIMKVADQIWPSLSIELLRIATGGQALLVRSDANGLNSLVVAGVAVPTDQNGRVWIHFSPHQPSRYISARDVLEGKASDRLAGRLAILGTSAVGLFDIKSTPVSPAMPGAEIHAQVLESILSGKQLVRPNYAIGAEMFLAIVVGVLMIILVPMLGALTTLFLGSGIAASVTAGSYYLFLKQGFVFDVIYPLASSLIIFGTLVFVNYVREEAQRRQIRGAFGQYLSPALVEQLAKDPDKLVLGGETKELSVMFSDVRGFTSISEIYKSDPQGLTHLINRLLTPLSNVVMGYQGTIDKYMGDNVMAFWNAPLDDKDHAHNACRAALDMLSALEELNTTREQEDLDAGRPNLPLNIGVGINTGDCVVGNIGSDVRFDYSILGDSVNLASRLEGQTKSYGVSVVVGARTADLARDEFAILPIDSIQVKGKEEPERIFVLVGDQTVKNHPDFGQLSSNHNKMLENYLARNWRSALQSLKACRTSAGKFGLSDFYDMYESRINSFRKAPPPPDWDGVYVATSK